MTWLVLVIQITLVVILVVGFTLAYIQLKRFRKSVESTRRIIDRIDRSNRSLQETAIYHTTRQLNERSRHYRR